MDQHDRLVQQVRARIADASRVCSKRITKEDGREAILLCFVRAWYACPMTDALPPEDRLDDALRRRVLDRMGLTTPPPRSLGGLFALYRAWCAHVPFDNIQKVIALRTSRPGPLPGIDAEDFLTRWLHEGTGGTCWTSSNALYVLARTLGFDARRIAASMRDTGILTHASTVVHVGPDRWLLDSAMLTDVPLPLGQEVFVHEDPVYAAEVEPADDAHVVWWDCPPNPEYLPCRLQAGPVDHRFYREGYETSRARGPFNQRLYIRRNFPREMRLIVGNTRYSQTADGLDVQHLTEDGLVRALVEEMGVSPGVVEAWSRAGGLSASFEAPEGPPPPAPSRPRPSRR